MVTSRAGSFHWCFKVIISTGWLPPACRWRLLQSQFLKWWEFIQGGTWCLFLNTGAGAGRCCSGWVTGWGQEVGSSSRNSSRARDEQQEIKTGRRGHATTVPVLKLGISENVGAHICRVVVQGTETGLLLCICDGFCILHLQWTHEEPADGKATVRSSDVLSAKQY